MNNFHLCLSEVETAGNFSPLGQGKVLGALEPGTKVLRHGNTDDTNTNTGPGTECFWNLERSPND